jgi:hypothetical protein
MYLLGKDGKHKWQSFREMKSTLRQKETAILKKGF